MRREFSQIVKFMRVYDQKVSEHPGKAEAYKAAEKHWESETGSAFYLNYNSFCASRTYFFKRKRLMNVRTYRSPSRS